VVVSDAGSSTEILIRARYGNRVLEARFDSVATAAAGETFSIAVEKSTQDVLVLRAFDRDGKRIAPAERRRITIEAGRARTSSG
jgi:hypothetical protein